jgi:lipoyl(octanoyl) transferase
MTSRKVTDLEPIDRPVRVYLLGTLDFEAALRFQRRLHFEIREDRDQAALLICEHPPSVSVGRQGSHAHIRWTGDETLTRRHGVRWVNRGGGCILHLPGQLAVYPILPLDRLELNVADYLRRLGQVFLDLAADFSLHSPAKADDAGMWVGGRMVAAFGIAVHDWVSTFGAYLNVQPSLDLFRQVQTFPADQPMSSLERERRGPIRPSMLRQRLVEHFQARFGFARAALFTDHPSLMESPQRRRRAVSRRAAAG